MDEILTVVDKVEGDLDDDDLFCTAPVGEIFLINYFPLTGLKLQGQSRSRLLGLVYDWDLWGVRDSIRGEAG